MGEDGVLMVCCSYTLSHIFRQDVNVTDAGFYNLTAVNVYGSDSGSFQALIGERTRILQTPENLTVVGGSPANFSCAATTDPQELKVINFYMREFAFAPCIFY